MANSSSQPVPSFAETVTILSKQPNSSICRLRASSAAKLSRRSTLLMTAMAGPPFCRAFTMPSSLSVKSPAGSNSIMVTSTSLRLAAAVWVMRLSRRLRAAWMPGVSISTYCTGPLVMMPVMRLRVVWGFLVTMATFSPTRWLVRLDLPTLGRPTSATKTLLGC